MKKICMAAAAVALLALSADSFSAITVESVEGKVAFKDGGAWKALAKNQSLKEGTKISTGVASSAVIRIDNATVTVRPMSMMGITRNLVKDGTSSTNLGLKYGGINAKVAKLKDIRTNFKISTPIATSSVRGTEEEVSFGPKSGMIVKVIAGLVNLENPSGVSTTVGRFQKFQLKRGNARPQSLLSGLRATTFINVMPEEITETEKEFFEFFGEELRENPGDEQLIFEEFPSGKINIRIVFPPAGPS